jgi:glycolate oxidase FAD binding subunit
VATATIIKTEQSSPPADIASVAEFVRARYADGQQVRIVGGSTALDYGPDPAGAHTLDISPYSRIVDYTPRDMTILVEAGVRMADLAATLAAEGQHLPIDVPRAGEATLGGVIATNWNGPRRYGHGTIRDYVIGIHAVDGRGVAFKGGGRVVKNVAGYDFCKLLTGSLGTLAVITQVALKVKPQPEEVRTIVGECPNLQTADAAVARLSMLESLPVAIDLLAGKPWDAVCKGTASQAAIHLAVRIEGTNEELTWLSDRIKSELNTAGASEARLLNNDDLAKLWHAQVEFPDRSPDAHASGEAASAAGQSPVIVKFIVPPTSVTNTIAQLLDFDPTATIQAHAASGIIIARFTKFTQADVSPTLVGRLRPGATRLGGSVEVVRTTLAGLTSHLIWGGRTDSSVLLERIKKQFDPKNILNPGRYIY